MPSRPPLPTRLESLELLIARFLRYGVIVAGSVIFVGWMMQINFSQNVFTGFSTYTHAPLLSVLENAWAQRQWNVMISYLGLGLLIALPFFRVVLTAVVFMMDRDFLMAACALLVISGLLLSLTLGFQI